MTYARQAAFEILTRMERSGAYSNLITEAKLRGVFHDNRDKALASAIVCTVLERLITIDYNLSLYLEKPIEKLKPEVLTILRIGACQLLYFDRIPASACVCESVELARRNRLEYACSLMNAVLRKVAKNGLRLPEPSQGTLFASVKYSVPEDLYKLLCSAYGEQSANGILSEFHSKAPTYIRVNTLRCDTARLSEALAREGIETKTVDICGNVLKLQPAVNPAATSAFSQGLYHVQDLSSQLLCEAIAPARGDIVFDMCAAPGGKSFTLAQLMEGTGVLKAFEIHPSRVGLVKKGAERLGLQSLECAQGDSTVFDAAVGMADEVLCDVPCSGLGAIRKKPEIRYKPLGNIDNLRQLQYFILCNSALYVKPGGLLVYSTCTLNPAENEHICERFLQENPGYSIEKPAGKTLETCCENGFVTIFPQQFHSDGFFFAMFRKAG
ncbi:MAG TPA: 16S rRNA (cytosine(967)-C(5))-methyltransferase RsmB [Clostridiales bacterium]|nr:16S rRNA (cytosine(967)-C(5))-methyltransferase RsmB [Clostridiales bacterium]HQK74164.1 16S rRNA (cytosine(967)-C(5))-methyltransferase RsmB [Clostridiales bacterium]